MAQFQNQAGTENPIIDAGKPTPFLNSAGNVIIKLAAAGENITDLGENGSPFMEMSLFEAKDFLKDLHRTIQAGKKLLSSR